MPNFVPEFPVQWTTVLNAYQIANQSNYIVGSTVTTSNYPSSGMVNHFRFDDATGGNWIDSLNNNNAMYVTSSGNWISVAGRINTAAQKKNNVNSQEMLESPSTIFVCPNFANAWSVSFWMNIQGFTNSFSMSSSNSCLVWANYDNRTGAAVCHSFTNGNSYYSLAPGFGVNTGSPTFGPTTNVTLGTWAHVVLMYDGSSTLTLYVNASLVGTLSVGSLTNDNFVSLLSNYTNGGTTTFDDMTMYSRVLTGTEISNLYSGPVVTNGTTFDCSPYSFTQFSVSCTYNPAAIVPLLVYILDDVDGTNFQGVTEPSRTISMPFTQTGVTQTRNYTFTVLGKLERKFQLALGNYTGDSATVTIREQRVPIVALHA